MSDGISRREFVVTSTAGLAAAAASPAFGAVAGRPMISAEARPRPVVIASGNGHRFKNGGNKTCVETAFAQMMQGDRRARRARSPASTSSSSIRSTRASATAACRTPTASCSSTPAACTARRSAPAASARIEGVRTPSLVALKRDGGDRPSPDRRQGRAGVRAQHGLQDRGRPEHPSARARPGSNGSGGPIRCTTSIRSSARRRCGRSIST